VKDRDVVVAVESKEDLLIPPSGRAEGREP